MTVRASGGIEPVFTTLRVSARYGNAEPRTSLRGSSHVGAYVRRSDLLASLLVTAKAPCRRTHPERVKSYSIIAGIVAAFTDSPIEAQMGKSTYEIRVRTPVPLDLLEKFRQIESVESAGTILHASQLDDAAFWGLIDALRYAGIDLIEVRREVGPPSTRSSP